MKKRLSPRGLVALAASGALAVLASGAVAASTVAPRNTTPPSIVGETRVGETLRANTGTWTGTTPMTFAFQWRRCTRQNCRDIPGATNSTYTLIAADEARWMRVRVTATNRDGSASATSALSPRVRARNAPQPQPQPQPPAGGPAGQIRLAGGLISIPVTSVTPPQRLIISGVQFSPTIVRSRAPITARFRVTDTRGFVVREALVFARSTPLVTSTPPEQATGTDGWVTFTFVPRADFPLNGRAVQFFVRARKAGDNVLAGISSRRLVQVRTGR